MHFAPWVNDPSLAIPHIPGEEAVDYFDRVRIRYLDREAWRARQLAPRWPGAAVESEPAWTARLTAPEPSQDQRASDLMEQAVWHDRLALYRDAWTKGQERPFSEPDFRAKYLASVGQSTPPVYDPTKGQIPQIYQRPGVASAPIGLAGAIAALGRLTPEQRALVVQINAAWMANGWKGILGCYMVNYDFHNYPLMPQRIHLLMGLEEHTRPDPDTLARIQLERMAAQITLHEHPES